MEGDPKWWSAPTKLQSHITKDAMECKQLFPEDGLWNMYGMEVQEAHLRRAVLQDQKEEQTQSEQTPILPKVIPGRGRGRGQRGRPLGSTGPSRTNDMGACRVQVLAADSTKAGDPSEMFRPAMRPHAFSPRETPAKKKERIAAVEDCRDRMYEVLNDIERDRIWYDTESITVVEETIVPEESQHGPHNLAPQTTVSQPRLKAPAKIDSMGTVDLMLAGDQLPYSQSEECMEILDGEETITPSNVGAWTENEQDSMC